jgi:hypothetical protein
MKNHQKISGINLRGTLLSCERNFWGKIPRAKLGNRAKTNRKWQN